MVWFIIYRKTLFFIKRVYYGDECEDTAFLCFYIFYYQIFLFPFYCRAKPSQLIKTSCIYSPMLTAFMIQIHN